MSPHCTHWAFLWMAQQMITLEKTGPSSAGEQPNQVFYSSKYFLYNPVWLCKCKFFFEASTTHKILLQASVSIIPNSECSSKYGFKIAENSLCAFSGSQEGILCHVSLSYHFNKYVLCNHFYRIDISTLKGRGVMIVFTKKNAFHLNVS